MKIVRLAVENVKRVEAVAIEPQSDVVVIGGQNGAGKSSVLDSIAMAIGGKRLCPAKPLREGAKKGSVSVDLGEMKVVRTFTKSARNGEVKSEIVVTDAGGVISSPQALLDRLVGDLSFDPLEFTRMRPEEQVKVLRQVAGVDTTEVDKAIAAAFEQRKAIGAALKSAEAGIEELERFADVPETAPSVEDLMAQRDKMQARNRQREGFAAKRKEIALLRDQHLARVEELRRQIEAEQMAHDALTRKDGEIEAALNAAGAAEDLSDLSRQIGAVQETARRVEANKHYAKAEARVKALGEEHEKAETKLAELREKRVALVQAAKMPIDGLDLGDGGVLYRGLPFEQASSAEQLRVSVAMGLALNPNLKVLLIRDGSLLDDSNLAAIAEMAAQAEAQVWIERVGDGEEVSVVIEDGRVKVEEEVAA